MSKDIDRNIQRQAEEALQRGIDRLRLRDAVSFAEEALLPMITNEVYIDSTRIVEERLAWEERHPRGELDYPLAILFLADYAASEGDRELFQRTLEFRDVVEELGGERLEGLTDLWDSYNDPDWEKGWRLDNSKR